jgi:hypothetical protein
MPPIAVPTRETLTPPRAVPTREALTPPRAVPTRETLTPPGPSHPGSRRRRGGRWTRRRHAGRLPHPSNRHHRRGSLDHCRRRLSTRGRPGGRGRRRRARHLGPATRRQSVGGETIARTGRRDGPGRRRDRARRGRDRTRKPATPGATSAPRGRCRRAARTESAPNSTDRTAAGPCSSAGAPCRVAYGGLIRGPAPLPGDLRLPGHTRRPAAPGDTGAPPIGPADTAAPDPAPGDRPGRTLTGHDRPGRTLTGTSGPDGPWPGTVGPDGPDPGRSARREPDRALPARRHLLARRHRAGGLSRHRVGPPTRPAGPLTCPGTGTPVVPPAIGPRAVPPRRAIGPASGRPRAVPPRRPIGPTGSGPGVVPTGRPIGPAGNAPGVVMPPAGRDRPRGSRETPRWATATRAERRDGRAPGVHRWATATRAERRDGRAPGARRWATATRLGVARGGGRAGRRAGRAWAGPARGLPAGGAGAERQRRRARRRGRAPPGRSCWGGSRRPGCRGRSRRAAPSRCAGRRASRSPPREPPPAPPPRDALDRTGGPSWPGPVAQVGLVVGPFGTARIHGTSSPAASPLSSALDFTALVGRLAGSRHRWRSRRFVPLRRRRGRRRVGANRRA